MLQTIGNLCLGSVKPSLVDSQRGLRAELGGNQEIRSIEGGAVGVAYKDSGAQNAATAAERSQDRAPIP
ncbi:cephalosporin C hydroxylation activity protein [Streptomyces pristinaespiralis]|uniref:Cephalosporin C hydroxylation activity protein n=1 Tax=Streptomyces pristinaespiralis TaxID=38300 RepID=A0A0M4DED8_STRPR|nr:cephalosporin C hydroxylation activity protein [Streptomyces pristinaespiralis]